MTNALLNHSPKRYGKIVSTKAIIDKTTNNCKGYGFVDFDSPVAAENAVKQLQIQGIEAQMAKVSNRLRVLRAVPKNPNHHRLTYFPAPTVSISLCS